MLVHMTPDEVGGLQALAMAGGGSLSINPETGLPEAGFLKKLLPTILGVGLAATGVGAPLAAGIVGAGQTALTGDLGKGLMAGLGAFGGASLAGGVGIGAAGEAAGNVAATNVGQTVGSDIALNVADQSAQQLAQTISPELAAQGVKSASLSSALSGGTTALSGAAPGATSPLFTIPAGGGPMPLDALVPAGQTAVKTAAEQAVGETAGSGLFGKFGDRFGEAAREGLSGKVAKYAPAAAAVGLGTNVMSAMEPEYRGFEDEDREVEVNVYGQPKFTGARRPEGEAYRGDPYRGEMLYFDPVKLPVIGTKRVPYAEGDEVEGGLGDILPAYTQMFQTSPGPITGVPFGYGEGRAPSELIRAQMTESTPTGGAEVDFGIEAPSRVPSNPFGNFFSNVDFGAYGDLVDPDIISEYMTNLYYGTPGGMGPPSGSAPINEARGGGASPSIDPSPYAPPIMGGGNASMPAVMDIQDVAMGGAPEMSIESGGFVMPARETAEFGNGSTMAGQDILAALGGIPINGAGDGVSDSIPAMIDGTQPAALASGETYFPPQTVEAMGGAEQMRKLMEQAQRSRKTASRGGLNTMSSPFERF